MAITKQKQTQIQEPTGGCPWEERRASEAERQGGEKGLRDASQYVGNK